MSIRMPALVLIALALPAAANENVWVVQSPNGGQTSFATALAIGGDHDGDGFPDVLLGARYAPGGGLFQVRSGRTGALIRQIPGTVPFGSFGWHVAHVDDADGDGAPDMLVHEGSEARLLSGASGALIRAHSTPRPSAGVGDWNGDGRGDYAICHSDAVRLRSGLDGSELFAIAASPIGTPVVVGDVTGDGIPDLALARAVIQPVPLPTYGRVSVYSGASGAEVHGFDAHAQQLFGRLITVADRDGDGRRDLAIAHPDAFPVPGVIEVRSSATSALLMTIANPEPCGTLTNRSGFGSALAEVGDVDLDGVPDIAAGSHYPRGLWVFSGATGARRMAVQTPHSEVDWFVNVAGLPDIDGDGRAELVYGDPSDYNGPTSGGSLFAVRGTSDNSHGIESCFGDGSGSACPCGNLGAPGQGCANTTGAGATLRAYGTTSIAEHDLWFQAEELPGGSSGSTYLFFGTAAVNGGLGIANFAGLRCAGGSLRRTGQHSYKGGGVASWVPNLVQPLFMSAGNTYYFQSMYRDVTSPCATANFTNLVTLVLAP